MRLELPYSYESCVAASEKVAWSLDAVFPLGTNLDFSRSFLPEGLAPTSPLSEVLSVDERRVLNQIASNAYLNLFAFVEEYILCTVVQHASAELFGDHAAIRALVRFADEEIKHQQLFRRYRDAFDRDFGVPCEVLESAAEVAGVVLSKRPIAVLLLTLHIEFMTQQHYTECVRDDGTIDPLFQRLLKQHWLEESQHAKIDALELAKLVEDADDATIEAAFKDYLELGGAIGGLLAEQSAMDVRSLERKLGKTFDDADRARITANQLAGYQHTFLHAGMTNPQVVDIMQRLHPAMAEEVATAARGLGQPTEMVA